MAAFYKQRFNHDLSLTGTSHELQAAGSLSDLSRNLAVL